jgi:hypothetical protein
MVPVAAVPRRVVYARVKRPSTLTPSCRPAGDIDQRTTELLHLRRLDNPAMMRPRTASGGRRRRRGQSAISSGRTRLASTSRETSSRGLPSAKACARRRTNASSMLIRSCAAIMPVATCASW